jgi:hypothetical protein
MVVGIALIVIGLFDQFMPRIMKSRLAKRADDSDAVAAQPMYWLFHLVGAVCIAMGVVYIFWIA